MGKIKPKAIRKTAGILGKEGVEFSNNFEENKKMLSRMQLSKKLRNQLAGLMSRKRSQAKPILK